MNSESRDHCPPLPRADTARRAAAEGRPVAIQAALDALEDDDADTFLAFLWEATPAEVEQHAATLARATAKSERAFLADYQRERAALAASTPDPVSPIPPPPTGDGEDGERTSGSGPNGRKSSFGDYGENGDTESKSRIALTPFCDLVAPPLPPEAYLFGDILVRGAVTLLSGAPGSGKSTFAYFVAGRLARDGTVLGRGPGEPLPVGYFDAESSASLAREKAMLATEGEETRHFMKLSDDGFSNIGELITLLREHHIQLLVVDTLSRALPIDNDNDSRDARQRIMGVQRIARDANVAVLGICHQPKAQHATPVHNVLGSVETAAGVDVVIVAKASGSKGHFLDLEVAKNRLATGGPTGQLRLRKAGSGTFEPTEDAAATVPTKQEAVVDAIQRGARERGRITRQEALGIAQNFDAGENTTDRALEALVDAGVLRKTARGVYELIDADARTAESRARQQAHD